MCLPASDTELISNILSRGNTHKKNKRTRKVNFLYSDFSFSFSSAMVPLSKFPQRSERVMFLFSFFNVISICVIYAQRKCN